ncbi:MAG: FAD-binding domain-containing protein [candidate division WOR-3 bacterium]
MTFRVFNPEIQRQKFDPNFEYIKTYIPNYQNYEYKPIVDFYESRKNFINKAKKIYEL